MKSFPAWDFRNKYSLSVSHTLSGISGLSLSLSCRQAVHPNRRNLVQLHS
jgi:hypothetical protein